MMLLKDGDTAVRFLTYTFPQVEEAAHGIKE